MSSQSLSEKMCRKEKKFNNLCKELATIEEKFLPQIQEYKEKIEK